MSWKKLIPCFLAVFYLAFVMRGAEQGPAAPDGGQHATNGALIYDYVRTALGTSPVQFAKEYLVHYPAISVGYHPPMFHAIEACFYGLFGVTPNAARLTVAIMAALSIVLLYSLIRRTHGSTGFATLCVVVFMSLEMSQQLASDVMLEFPSLVFVLLALHCLLGFQNGFHWRAAIGYALISSAAIWTKQHAVFLGLIPFFMIAMTGQWSQLKRLPIWAGALLFGASCLMLAAFMSAIVGDDYLPTSQVAVGGRAQFVVLRNLSYYMYRLNLLLGWPILVATSIACVAYGIQRIRDRQSVESLSLYAAWAAAVLPVPLIAWQHDERYVFASFPAFIVILLDMVRRAAGRFASQNVAPWITVGAAILLFGVHVRDDVTRSSGPVEAARYVWEKKPKRVLVCDRGEYQFVFAIRCLAGNQPAMVILRGSKVPFEALQPENFDTFGHDYGIEYVVIGDAYKAFSREYPEWRIARAWDAIRDAPTADMRLDQKIPMTSPFKFMVGDVLIYEFTNPSPTPKNDLDLRMSLLDLELKVDIGDGDAPPEAQGP